MPSQKTDNANKEEALKGSNTFVHPKSRKCLAMVKKIRKDSKKERLKQDRALIQSVIADKLLWFQKNMDPIICPYTTELVGGLIEKYIARNDEELEQIKLKRSIGGNSNRHKQHASREDAIRMTKEREKMDYESCGLEIPNILNKSQCTMLKNWNGNLKFLPNFTLTRFGKKHLVKLVENKKTLKQTVLTLKLSDVKHRVDGTSETNLNTLNILEKANRLENIESKDTEEVSKDQNEENMEMEE